MKIKDFKLPNRKELVSGLNLFVRIVIIVFILYLIMLLKDSVIPLDNLSAYSNIYINNTFTLLLFTGLIVLSIISIITLNKFNSLEKDTIMKKLTYFKLNNFLELQTMYRDFAFLFEQDILFIKGKYNLGYRIVYCNNLGLITLIDDIEGITSEAKEIDNPFEAIYPYGSIEREEDREVKKEVKKEIKIEPLTSKKEVEQMITIQNQIKTIMSNVTGIPNGERLERLNIIIANVGIDIEPNKLYMLIKVIDLDNKKSEQVTLNDMKSLKEENDNLNNPK